MTNTLLFSPVIIAVDASGVPIANAELFTYATGTTTGQATYKDSALLVPHTNPVVSDEQGRFAAIYMQDTTYKMVLKTPEGVELWTVDPINPNVILNSTGNLALGASSPTHHIIARSGLAEGATALLIQTTGSPVIPVDFQRVDGGGVSSSPAAIRVQKHSGNDRSINAAGTINASGADYAERMPLAEGVIVSKGDVVGRDKKGRITDSYDESIGFLVVSTNPSFVGGDFWEQEGFTQEQLVEIAFCGLVPINTKAPYFVNDAVYAERGEEGEIVLLFDSFSCDPASPNYIGQVWYEGKDGRPIVRVG